MTPERRPLRVAAIGASGIGKHHLKWYSRAGCEVVAFVGTSKESVEKTAAALKDVFPFEGRGYTSVREMLAKEAPDIVSVCTPHECHRDHVIKALQAGCNVLCEKPLVWDRKKDGPGILDDARRVITAAEKSGKLLSVNTQMVTAVNAYKRIYEKHIGPLDGVRRFHMQMDTFSMHSNAPREFVFTDLAAHPLSLLIAFCPDGKIDESNSECLIGKDKAEARFHWVSKNGQVCEASFLVRRVEPGPRVRVFGVNDFLVSYEGQAAPSGNYHIVFKIDGQEYRHADPMQSSITQFVRAVEGKEPPAVSMDAAVKNLYTQVRLFFLSRIL